jgi:hypothetical protein
VEEEAADGGGGRRSFWILRWSPRCQTFRCTSKCSPIQQKKKCFFIYWSVEEHDDVDEDHVMLERMPKVTRIMKTRHRMNDTARNMAKWSSTAAFIHVVLGNTGDDAMISYEYSWFNWWEEEAVGPKRTNHRDKKYSRTILLRTKKATKKCLDKSN